MTTNNEHREILKEFSALDNELIERLRHIASKGVSVWGDLQMEAADALEDQAKQIEALFLALETERGAANLYAKQVLYWINKNDKKLEQIETLQADAEQDEALIRQMLKAINAMLTHMGMDEDDWNKPTFDQCRASENAARARLGGVGTT